MANLAAIIPSARALLEVHKVDIYKPGPEEILVKNEVIVFNPVEFKAAKFAIFPLQYPAILGSTFGGIVEAIGTQVSNFKVGEKVVVTKEFKVPGNQYGAWQRYTLVKDVMVSKVPAGIDVTIPASLMMNLTCVVGLFTGRLGLEKPSLGSTPVSVKVLKILVYGGSSSIGSLSVQYLSQAGYKVVTTSSRKHHDFVSKLGALVVVDHTLEPTSLLSKLVAEGPYDIAVDMISLPETVAVMGQVLAAQGGGKLYAMDLAYGPEKLPDGVTRVFEPWSDPLYEENNYGLIEWVTQTYLPQGLSQGFITPLPIEKVHGGLNGVNEALERLQKGVSGIRLVADPWE
ncbi:alcohol dehydrogenase GroES-like domain-containing protein [Polychaeton citri CBS 116435]|uniref:Alcohol dehydrogenase GroES-like domain-containing protein n=1 Tax=Polychaeton citri CBS 116435 TaxID=1314669 RepID=A0A9P4PZJ9_9PEZI|nr:alcohol dehydrogenase GroES-like domain-containing protein [Polychaeton citri CBS 116435]